MTLVRISRDAGRVPRAFPPWRDTRREIVVKPIAKSGPAAAVPGVFAAEGEA